MNSRRALRWAVLDECRRAVGTPARRWLAIVTLVVGLLVAIALGVASPPAGRTFLAVSAAVQSLMSVTVPFFGVLLVTDLRRDGEARRLLPTWVGAAVVAVAVALFGIVISAVATAVGQSTAAEGRWADAGVVVAGSVLVQVVAQSVGTGLGLLLRPAAWAMAATIVLPLGLWLILEAVDALRPVQAWLTPFAAVRNVFSGEMSSINWLQWFVVMLLWGVGLNTLGAIRVARARG